MPPARQRDAALLAAEIAAERRYRTEQAALAALVAKQVADLWVRFDPQDAERSWAPIRKLLVPLLRDRSNAGLGLARRFYTQVRGRAGISAPFRPPAIAPPPLEQVQKTVDSTGLGEFLHRIKVAYADPASAAAMYGDEVRREHDESHDTDAGTDSRRVELDPDKLREQAAEAAGEKLGAASTRLTLLPGREFNAQAACADDKALGWLRVPDDDPCYWCAMLASRGLVTGVKGPSGRYLYRSRETAGGGADGYHDHCECRAVPVFYANDPRLAHADELYHQWTEATKGKSKDDALNAWRRHWDGRRKNQEA